MVRAPFSTPPPSPASGPPKQEGKVAAKSVATWCRCEEWKRSTHNLSGSIIACAAHVHEGITMCEEERFVERLGKEIRAQDLPWWG